MSQFLEDHWGWMLALGVGSIALWLGLSRYGLGVLVWGPFAPLVDNYLTKRGGFTKREKIGWGIVGLLMLIVLVTAFIGP